MPKGSDITGDDLVKYFQKHGFLIVSRRGSHVTLRNSLGLGTTIPVHNKPLGEVTIGCYISSSWTE